jgi:predicted RNase H-like HicB family nuclease
MYTYKIHLHQEEEGGFTVTVPTLPGLYYLREGYR